MKLGVVIPTVDGREADYHLCRNAYLSTTPGSIFALLRTQRNYDTCGEAWQAGAEALLAAGADVLHFTADDLIPQPGWAGEAFEFLRAGKAPAPVLLNLDGSVWNYEEPPGAQVGFPRVPLLLAEWLEAMPPIPPIHYHSDCWIGDQLQALGIPMEVAGSYRFIHTWAQPGRKRTDNPRDIILYERARKGVL